MVKALKMQPQDVDSVLVKALCACGPLTKSSNVNLQELVVRLPGVDSFNPEESHNGGLCDRDFDSQGGSRKDGSFILELAVDEAENVEREL